MDKKQLYLPHIIKVADKYAYHTACKRDLVKLHCPGYYTGVQDAVLQILQSGLIEPDILYEYFDNLYKDDAPINWWKLNV